jgi:hypothetical protein
LVHFTVTAELLAVAETYLGLGTAEFSVAALVTPLIASMPMAILVIASNRITVRKKTSINKAEAFRTKRCYQANSVIE